MQIYIPTQIVIFQELIKSEYLCKLTFYVSHMFQCFLEFFESPSQHTDPECLLSYSQGKQHPI